MEGRLLQTDVGDEVPQSQVDVVQVESPERPERR
jgi:hypothetical protein